MVHFRRLFSLVLVMVLVLTTLPCALAATGEPSNTVVPDEVLASSNFVAMTREDYIRELAATNGTTFAEAEASLEQDIQAYESSLISPCSWEGDTAVDQGGGTSYVYGRVYKIYTHDSGLQMIYSVQAVLARSHYGSGWISCNTTGTAYPYGSGDFTFTGSCTASLVSSSQLRMACEGYFQVTVEFATSQGIGSFFSVSLTESGTRYYRDNIYTTHIETATQSS